MTASGALWRCRLRLGPHVRLDEAEAALWVPRRNPLERAFAVLLGRGRRVRIGLDARSLQVLTTLRRLGAPTVAELAGALGLPAAPDVVGDAEADRALGALLVFLAALVRGRALMTEPI